MKLTIHMLPFGSLDRHRGLRSVTTLWSHMYYICVQYVYNIHTVYIILGAVCIVNRFCLQQFASVDDILMGICRWMKTSRRFSWSCRTIRLSSLEKQSICWSSRKPNLTTAKTNRPVVISNNFNLLLKNLISSHLFPADKRMQDGSGLHCDSRFAHQPFATETADRSDLLGGARSAFDRRFAGLLGWSRFRKIKKR